MANNASLYGVRQPKSSAKQISSSTSLAFSSQLSSLLSAGAQPTTRTSSGRPRPSHAKPDIFTTHNRNARKRAARDLADDDDDGHVKAQHRQDLGGVDAQALQRSRRKLEEKARLYAAMKRGDYVPPEKKRALDAEENALVDFDRKWAENEERGEGNELDTSTDDDGDNDNDDDDDGGDAGGGGGGGEELVEYMDEFGRTRKGTRAEAAREERRKRTQAAVADEPERFTARPAAPAHLIYGDVVQTAAFDPDVPVASKMDELARRRDRSVTPPEAVHYDATAEVRSKGVGFYAFSQDGEARAHEMRQLERERRETERSRQQTAARREKKKAELEERRRIIREKKGAKQADQFLERLAGGLEGAPAQAAGNDPQDAEG